MKTAVVGDIHGRLEVMEDVLDTADYDRIVFVGDYVDSFSRTKLDQLQCLELALAAHNGEDVICLRGNHEESYLDPDYRCSGWNPVMDTHFLDKKEAVRALPAYTWVDGILITHAGVSKHFLDEVLYDRYLYMGLSDIGKVDKYLEQRVHPEVGYARGGSKSCGGLMWCDWFEEFAPIPGLRQIMGHSGYREPGIDKGVLRNGDNWNVDCLDHTRKIIVIENGEVSVELLDV